MVTTLTANNIPYTQESPPKTAVKKNQHFQAHLPHIKNLDQDITMPVMLVMDDNLPSENYGRLATLFGGLWGGIELINGFIKVSQVKSAKLRHWIEQSKNKTRTVNILLPGISSLVAGISAVFAVLHFMHHRADKKQAMVKYKRS